MTVLTGSRWFEVLYHTGLFQEGEIITAASTLYVMKVKRAMFPSMTKINYGICIPCLPKPVSSGTSRSVVTPA